MLVSKITNAFIDFFLLCQTGKKEGLEYSLIYVCMDACVCVASCGSIGVEWFGNAVNCSYGIVNHQRLQHTHTHTHTHTYGNTYRQACCGCIDETIYIKMLKYEDLKTKGKHKGE